jgi:hypothetical protein
VQVRLRGRDEEPQVFPVLLRTIPDDGAELSQVERRRRINGSSDVAAA